MTQFEHLELLYNQFLNLIDEINSLIRNEEYESAVEKLEHKNKLINKIVIARKTVNFTDEQMKEASLIERNIEEKERESLIHLKKIQNEVGEEINNIKKKVKINAAYTIKIEEQQGDIVDILE